MSENERILQLLIDQQGEVSISYLIRHLGLHRRRAVRIVEMLERAGFVRIRQLDRVVLVGVTPLGWSKSRALAAAPSAIPKRKRESRLMTVVGVSLITLLVGFMWWWLDLFPRPTTSSPANVASLPVTPPVPSSTTLPLSSATNDPPPPDTPAPTPTTVPSPTVAVQDTPTLAGPSALPTAVPISTPDPSLQWGIPTPVPLQEQPAESVNIVLMGTDTSSGSWRTDTLIVVSVDPNQPSVSMLSIPRDLYVYIPNWKMSRINTADYHGEQVGYPGGGPGLVKATLEYNLGIRVHFFARVNFDGFVDILETLGGVDVVVDCELHDTFPNPAAPGGRSDIDLLPGVHHLDGKQALWYARSRWNTSDFDRGRRQQRVLRGALSRVMQLELLPQLPELWDDLTQTVQTDLNLETALWLAHVASRLDPATAIKSRFIDNLVLQSWRSPEGAAVQLPIYDRIRPLVADALSAPDTARARQAPSRVEVLNGTTRPNWAILAADRLMWEGFQVVNVAPADRTDYQRTTVFDIAGSAKGSATEYLTKVLNAGETDVLPAESRDESIDFQVIIGYDYQPCYKTYWRTVHAPTPTPRQ